MAGASLAQFRVVSSTTRFFFFFFFCFRDKRRRSGSREAGPQGLDQAPLEGFGGAGTGTLSAVSGGFGHSPAKRLRCTIFFYCVCLFFVKNFFFLKRVFIRPPTFLPVLGIVCLE